MTPARILGGGAALLVATAAALSAARLVAPPEWLAALGIAVPEEKPATAGWGATAAPAEPEPAPLIDLSGLDWMAWTPATGAFFLFILACLATMTALEVFRPGGAPRDGALGLETTRGDRLFITLLGSGYIFLGWLAVMGTPLWGGLGLALAWAAFVFWRA